MSTRMYCTWYVLSNENMDISTALEVQKKVIPNDYHEVFPILHVNNICLVDYKNLDRGEEIKIFTSFLSIMQ